MEWWRARSGAQKVAIVVVALFVLGTLGNALGGSPEGGPATTASRSSGTTARPTTTAAAPSNPVDAFYAGVRGDLSCRELFDFRNELDPGDSEIEAMNEALRSIGCFSSTSQRTDR